MTAIDRPMPQTAAGVRVLVVDDEEAVRNVVVRQLTGLGHRVVAAANGTEALAVLEAAPDIDLLFVDLTMPGMGGQEVAQRARSLRPALKVLFASGNFDDRLAGHGACAEAAHFIFKPYRRKDLAEKLREVLGSPKH